MYILGAFGLVLGGFGMVYSLNSATSLLEPRDQYVRVIADNAEKSPIPIAPPAELRRMGERIAEVRYSRRGVVLPLAGMDFILSTLLLAGCLRAMRGQSWGLSAWSLAALASIPYQLLDGAFAIVQARDLERAFADLTPPISPALGANQAVVSVLFDIVQIFYYGACVIYLRRASLRRRFTSGAGSPPAA